MNSTVTGATVSGNFYSASGASAAFNALFPPGMSVSLIDSSGLSTFSGADSLTASNVSVTVSGSAVADGSSGGNSITTVKPASVFAAPGDTITSAAATTVWGAGSGTTTFSLTGADDSVTGGAGYITGSASGANSTLIGGTGGGAFTVGGSGSLAVAGQAPGTTNITLTETTGGSEIATNPGTNQGTLIATLSPTGADTVIGGGGASTITGGGGDDVFGFVTGHAGGSETILNFTTSDTFAFSSGYGANPIQTETYTAGANGAGADVITLTDGTTITIEGQFLHSIFGKTS
jgi:hypothetical protein